MGPIASFSGLCRFLSNFFIAFFLVDVGFGPQRYASVEHAFQAAKAATKEGHDLIAAAPTPGHAKRMGRVVKLREDWEQVREDIMYRCVQAKFVQNTGLRVALLRTNTRELIEGNTWGDRIWGCVWNSNNARWEGQNLLGQTLMRVRAELAAVPPSLEIG